MVMLIIGMVMLISSRGIGADIGGGIADGDHCAGRTLVAIVSSINLRLTLMIVATTHRQRSIGAECLDEQDADRRCCGLGNQARHGQPNVSTSAFGRYCKKVCSAGTKDCRCFESSVLMAIEARLIISRDLACGLFQ
jgi:hypothetical protein